MAAAAVAEAKRRGLAIPISQSLRPLHEWLWDVTPAWNWNWHYQHDIYQHLNNLTDGNRRKLMLFIPPRHGKSELVTIRYSLWRLIRDPQTRVIIGAYNQTLAEKFSRKIRRLSTGRLALSDDRTAVQDWETTAGGGVRAVGVGGGITGVGGDLIVIDDPVKSREEANSVTYRDKTWDWYTDDLYTRLEPGGAVILIMTRWHEDDLAGRILRSEDAPNWTVIRFPALAEKDDPLGRSVGDALCPDRYPREELLKIRTVQGGRSFSALYQQEPQEQEGDIFKRSWFGYERELPTGCRYVRYWDRAATADGGDFTAGVLMAKTPDFYVVVDVVRGQWSTYERDKKIRQTAEIDYQKYGNVRIVGEQEPGSSGVDAARAFVRLLDGFSVTVDRVTGDKATRAEPLASQCEAGSVRLMVGAWNEEFLDELCSFPNGAHDDQVDGASGAYNKLVGTLDASRLVDAV